MARRIRWQIVAAVASSLLVSLLLGQLALSTTAVSQPLVGGTYVEAVPGVPRQIIPLFNDPLSDPSGRDIGALVFDGLTRIGFDGLPQGALAESWQVEQGGTVYIFRLREDVRWHDGEPFSADDVIFTIRAIQDGDFEGDPALANLWSNVLVDRIDDATVRFTLSAPYAAFASAARVPIMPAHLLEDTPIEEWADSEFAQQPVGTGPYLLDELSGDRATLQANIHYFAGRPFVNRFVLRFIDAPQAAVPLLDRGDIQALGASSTLAPQLGQIALPPTFRRLSLPLDEYVTLSFNLREAPLDDLSLRRSLATGLDKNALVEQVYNGQVVRITSPILPGWLPYDPTVGWYQYNVEQAAQQLDTLGYEQQNDGIRARNGERLSFTLLTDNDPGRLAAAQEIARQWGTLGVQIEIIELDRATLRQRLQEHDFMLAIHGWARLGADPDVFELWHSSQAEDGLNYAGLRDDTIDELLLDGRIELDLAARNAAYGAFQRRWIELVPGIMLYQPLYTFTVSNNIDGLGFEQLQPGSQRLLVGREDRYRHVTRWFINSSREIRGTLR
jgi:peptide/nickel transport system substrate-binding protein